MGLFDFLGGLIVVPCMLIFFAGAILFAVTLPLHFLWPFIVAAFEIDVAMKGRGR